MSDRFSPLDLAEMFIATEVGHHTPAMREQAADFLALLADGGYTIVHPDDHSPPKRYHPGDMFVMGYAAALRDIFGDADD